MTIVDFPFLVVCRSWSFIPFWFFLQLMHSTGCFVVSLNIFNLYLLWSTWQFIVICIYSQLNAFSFPAFHFFFFFSRDFPWKGTRIIIYFRLQWHWFLCFLSFFFALICVIARKRNAIFVNNVNYVKSAWRFYDSLYDFIGICPWQWFISPNSLIVWADELCFSF